MNEKRPAIFLSYSSQDRAIADKIDKTFSAIGIALVRDERDIAYRDSIENFMVKSVQGADFTMMLLSDAYLKSAYCLFEAGELLKTPDFAKRVLPVVADNTGFVSPQNRKAYYQYWDSRIAAAEQDYNAYQTPDFKQQLQQFRTVRDIIADLFAALHDLRLETFAKLESTHYKALFVLLGIDKDGLLQKCIAVVEITDEEEQLIALDELQNEYPKNQEVDFLKALIYCERARFKAARKFCEDYIRNYTYDVHTVHYNLATILDEGYKDYQGAREQYEKAIAINPDYAWAHNNLGILLLSHFQDYAAARYEFEEAVRSKPDFGKAYRNLGLLVKDQFQDYEKAAYCFEKAIALKETDFTLCFHYALTAEKLGEPYVAENCYLSAIHFDPSSFDAHYRFARLLDSQIHDFAKAIWHYQQAIALDPTFAPAHTNLGILLVREFDDVEGAKTQFEEALKQDPESDAANYNYAVLLRDYLNDNQLACTHYKKAVQLNPKQQSQEFDSLCAGGQ